MAFLSSLTTISIVRFSAAFFVAGGGGERSILFIKNPKRIVVQSPKLKTAVVAQRSFVAMTASATTATDANNATSTTVTIDEGTVLQNEEASRRAEEFMKQMPPLDVTKRKRIYIIRHGQTNWNKEGKIQGGGYDIELNLSGKHQAQNVADALEPIPLDVIASSHLRRAHDTANVIHKKHPNAVRIVKEGFGEMRFGSFEGLCIHGPESTEETKDVFKKQNDLMNYDVTLHWPGPNGESTQCVETRAKQALTDIIHYEYPNANHIAIVAHGRTNKILLASLLTGNPCNSGPIKQGNTCINILDYDFTHDVYDEVLLNYLDHADDIPEWQKSHDIRGSLQHFNNEHTK